MFIPLCIVKKVYCPLIIYLSFLIYSPKLFTFFIFSNRFFFHKINPRYLFLSFLTAFETRSIYMRTYARDIRSFSSKKMNFEICIAVSILVCLQNQQVFELPSDRKFCVYKKYIFLLMHSVTNPKM